MYEFYCTLNRICYVHIYKTVCHSDRGVAHVNRVTLVMSLIRWVIICLYNVLLSQAAQLHSPVLTAIGLVSGNTLFLIPHRINVP